MNWQTEAAMTHKIIFLLALAAGLAARPLPAAETLPLAGEWRFALDRHDTGIGQLWFAKKLPDKIQLPGSLESQGYGDPISPTTPWVLSLYDHFWYLRADYAAYTNAGSVKVPFLCQPARHYLGAAWYQRDFEIPTNWAGQRVVLWLERPHWKSTVWLDDQEIGSDLSLCAPHEFDFGLVPPGPHRLTVRVDNRMILPYRPDAHSISDSLDNAWNGIVGKMELRATPPVWIEELQVYPHAATKSVTVKGRIGNITGAAGEDQLNMLVTPFRVDAKARIMAGTNILITWSTNGGTFETELNLQPDAGLWDEFEPTIYRFHMCLGKRDSAGTHFGLRDFHADGNQFILNGHPVYLRGTHFGGDFPLTGYPPADVASWTRIFLTCKNYGLNHMRFHSWCPPEAAFEAADELGFYLQVECGMWNDFSPGGAMEKMLYAETERIIRAYGNHPSFLLLSASNEAHGRWQQVLPPWVEHFRAADPRRLYTPDTGWVAINAPGPVTGADYLAAGRIGPSRLRGESGWFGGDYGRSLAGVNVPVVAHELGQWCAYPDFDVIPKFTGFMRPGNYEIFRDSAAAHGLLEKNRDFARASGQFQWQCYKEEIEANLRTPGMAGFQLLDLHDYTGQGTALVGLLDPFWDSKGDATADEFKMFCNATVPLARLKQRVFTTADPFDVPVEIAHYGAVPLDVATAGWQILNAKNEVMTEGRFAVTNIPIGKNIPLGNITTDLAKLPAPGQYSLRIVIGQASHVRPGLVGVLPPFINDWNFWLYPARISAAQPADILTTGSWADAEKTLMAGGKVLFTPRLADLAWDCPPLARVPIFWNALMGPTWSRMLGLWCDTNSPALAEFPTEAHCDWQWIELVRNARAVNLDRLPRRLTPIVSAIDDWNRNDKLGVIFEAKVGAGKLLVCAVDLDARPGAQQLRRSLLDYMAGSQFSPPTVVSREEIRSFLSDNLVMRKLGAQATADGQPADALLDGDPNTFWSSADTRGSRSQHPHEICISFPQPVAMSGLVFMPRQNQREHQGDLREFKLEASDGGNSWQPVLQSQLASTFDPQQVAFGKIVTARQLKLTVLSGFGSDRSAALAELAVIYAGPPLPENTRLMEYQRVRTATSDIDAGDAAAAPVGRKKKPAK